MSRVADLARGERVAPSRLTVREYGDQWVEQQQRLLPRTVEVYRTNLRVHVYLRLGRLRLQAVTVDDVARVIADAVIVVHSDEVPWSQAGDGIEMKVLWLGDEFPVVQESCSHRGIMGSSGFAGGTES